MTDRTAGPDASSPDGNEDLRRVLRQWQAPTPGAGLDARMWSAYYRPRPFRNWKWIPVAAGLILAAGIAGFWPSRASNLTTRMDAAGFRPIPDGAITVISTGEKK